MHKENSWTLIKLTKDIKIINTIHIPHHYHVFRSSFGHCIFRREIYGGYEPEFFLAPLSGKKVAVYAKEQDTMCLGIFTLLGG